MITDEKAKEGNDPASYHSASGRKCHSLWMEEMTEVCHIYLQAEVKEGVLTIQVRNEGSNFEEELLEKLKK